MTFPNLTPDTLQRHTTDQSYSRGEDYCRSGAVVSITQRQQTLEAEVEGNEVRPYRVVIDVDGGGVTQASCSCAYSFNGWCKHIVATLLTCIQQPEVIEQCPSLTDLLAPLTLVQTQDLVQRLVADQPELIEVVDRYVNLLLQPDLSSAKPSRPKRKTSVDPAPFNRRARDILWNAVHDWEHGRDDDDIGVDMQRLIKDALAFAEQGDAANAMVVLQGITEGAVDNWDVVDDYCGITPHDARVDFDGAWAEVFLSADLSEDDVLEWQETLESWLDLESFAMAFEALRQGWTYPPLVRVLQGDPSTPRAWTGTPPDWADDLTKIRLKILNQRERYEDYLNLAQVEGFTQEYLTMLGQLGRVDQAMTTAQTQMKTMIEAKALAEILREQNQLDQALEIAIKGLELEQDDRYEAYDFAVWTSDLAEGLEQVRAALDARISAFKFKPSFQDYEKIQQMAEADWSVVKKSLLQHLRKSNDWGVDQVQVDVFLHEGLVEDAIAAISKSFRAKRLLVWRVMDMVMAQDHSGGSIAAHCQWVIDTARSRAEPIMDGGISKAYSEAVEWLKRVKVAHHELGQDADWSRYYQSLVHQHGRKRKLMGLMQQHFLQE